jgi:uncharacterized protein YoaH (UPF0181 family)
MAKKDYSPGEDDFDFGDLKTGKEIAEIDNESEDKADDKGAEEVSDEVKGKDEKSGGAEDDKEDTEVIDKETEVKKGEEKKGDEKVADEEDEDIDIFAEKEETPADKKISLKKLAKELDVDLEKDDDEVEFKTKFSDKLEKSKQEFKLDGYSDDAKAVIKHLNENGGNIDSFFTNPAIASMQSVLALDPETKVRNVRIQEVMATGVTKQEAITTVDEELNEWGTRQIKDLASDIDDQAKGIINTEIKKIIGDQELKSQAERVRKETEALSQRTNLKGFIEKQDNFLGLGLTPEAKKLILRDIDNGNFDKVLSSNPEQIKFASYMFSKYGSKIMSKISSSLNEQNRKGHNAATRKALDALHKVGDEGGQRKTGHQATGKDQDSGNKPKWTDEDFG